MVSIESDTPAPLIASMTSVDEVFGPENVALLKQLFVATFNSAEVYHICEIDLRPLVELPERLPTIQVFTVDDAVLDEIEAVSNIFNWRHPTLRDNFVAMSQISYYHVIPQNDASIDKPSNGTSLYDVLCYHHSDALKRWF